MSSRTHDDRTGPEGGETLRDFLRYTASLSPHHEVARSAFPTHGRQGTNQHAGTRRDTQLPLIGRDRKRMASESQTTSPQHHARRRNHTGSTGGSLQPTNSTNTPPTGTQVAGTSSDPIDLTESPTHHSATRRISHPSHNPIPPLPASPSFVRGTLTPHWQPDDEVSSCPICRRPFSFIFRKHHCRKCGKVICAYCSVHRIRLMRSAIARQPGTAPPANVFPDPWGLEEVRVCNPCVPDPNVDAPRPYHSRNYSDGRDRGYGDEDDDTRGRWERHAAPGMESEREWDEAITNVMEPSRLTETPRPSSPTGNYHSSWLSSPYRPPPLPPSSTSTSLPGSSRYLRHHSSSRQRSTAAGSLALFPGYGQSSTSTAALGLSSSQRSPTAIRRIPEADLCPICSRELPPHDAADDDAARAEHIMACISRINEQRSRTVPHPNPHSHSRHPSSALSVRASSAHSQPPPYSHAHTDPRPAPLLTWIAGEKDCVDNSGDGERAAECVICLEEFEPGQELGRMECLCKFHRGCVEEWWRVKGMRRCPTHALQD